MSDKEEKRTRSPITEKPLHDPGESLRLKMDRLLSDDLVNCFLPIVVLFPMALSAWALAFLNSRDGRIAAALALTGMAVVSAIYFMLKFSRIRKSYASHRLGYDGERFVGEFLETLRKDGYEVVHDVVTGDANIDHVVIGHRGIYVVETKTRMKPERGEISVRVAEDGIHINGGPPDTKPIIQARAQARWLHEFFKRELDLDVFVQPTVVFPEWWVEESGSKADGEVWVLNQKRLMGYIRNSRQRLDEDTVRKTGHVLAKYVKSM